MSDIHHEGRRLPSSPSNTFLFANAIYIYQSLAEAPVSTNPYPEIESTSQIWKLRGRERTSHYDTTSP